MGLAEIETVTVLNNPTADYADGNRFAHLWGVDVTDYKYGGKQSDFERLLVNLSTSRATTIEDEINPLSSQVSKRNAKLEQYGNALAELSKAQASFNSDAHGSDFTSAQVVISQSTVDALGTLTPSLSSLVVWDSSYYKISKQNCEQAIQALKTKIDRLNNDSSADMTRLQSLVDKRDESFSTASSLMQSVSDTRSNALKNMA